MHRHKHRSHDGRSAVLPARHKPRGPRKGTLEQTFFRWAFDGHLSETQRLVGLDIFGRGKGLFRLGLLPRLRKKKDFPEPHI
jgi:hypothetical protein